MQSFIKLLRNFPMSKAINSKLHLSLWQGRYHPFNCRNSTLFYVQLLLVIRDREMRNQMADVIVVYWRDIPAQVIVGKGRKAAKVQLPERFEQAIDRAAMKIGAEDTDSYLAEWRKAPAYEVEGEQADVAQSEANRIDAEYDQTNIKQLIANDGWTR